MDIYVFYGVFDNVCLVRVGIKGFLYDGIEKTIENNVYNLKEAYDSGIINTKHLKKFPKTFY